MQKSPKSGDFGLPESIRVHSKEIDFALADVKICDPAIGSGAFPVGMMNEIVRARNVLTTHLKNQRKRDPYTFKWHCIESSLYGVDIDASAVEIAKLRLWLSLVVDEESYDHIRPLPNLDYRIICGNSLLTVEKNLFNYTLYPELEKKKLQYFGTTSSKNKEILREEIVGLIDQLTEGKKLFDFEVYFSEVFSAKLGFDVVIGNPPYGVSINGEERRICVKKIGKVPDYEIYYFFIKMARNLLKTRGTKAFIIPNTFLFNVFAANFRRELLDDWHINLIIDCTAFKIFKSATVYNAILIFQKEENSKKHIGYKQTLNAGSFSELSLRTTSYIPKATLLSNNTNWGLAFRLPKVILDITSKIKLSKQKVEVLFPDISQGLIAYDKYRGQNQETIKSRAFHYKEKSRPDLKEWLRGQDITPYKVDWNKQEYIDYCDGIANPRKPKFFKGNRVLVREITNPKIFAGFTSHEQYHDPAIIAILDNENGILPLLAILNSKLATFHHFNSSPKVTKGAFPKILVKDIKEFPLPEWLQTQELTQLVAQILSHTEKSDYLENGSSQVAVKKLEQEIDGLVYELYNLTEDEKAIIEESVGR